MIYRHTEEQVLQYYNSKRVNQSLLKILIKDGVQKMVEEMEETEETGLYYEEKGYFITGTAVDHYFSYGPESFENKYFTSRLIKKPSDTIMSIIKETFDCATKAFKEANPETEYTFSLDDSDLDSLLGEKIEAHGYQNNWKLDTRLSKVRKEGATYWEELKSAVGKQILSEEESNCITNVITSLKDHPFTSHYFVDEEGIDVVYQLPIPFDITDPHYPEVLRCKALLDLVRIDHNNQTIQPLDIKTLSGYILDFGQQVKAFRYDFQGAFYKLALELGGIEILSRITGIDLSEYTVLPFTFLAQSTKKIDVPLVFEMSEELMRLGLEGDDYNKGVIDATRLYRNWAAVNFSLEENFAPNMGIIKLDHKYNLIYQ